jgi:hypothetical protein
VPKPQYLRKPNRDPSHQDYVPLDVFPAELYPAWALDEGYLLSRRLNECALSVMTDAPYVPLEGVATGLLAQHCGITCQNDGWEWWRDPKGLAVVSHPLQTRDQIRVDWHEAWKKGKM